MGRQVVATGLTMGTVHRPAIRAPAASRSPSLRAMWRSPSGGARNRVRLGCTRSRCERWACSRAQQGFDGAPGNRNPALELPPCRQQEHARAILGVSPRASHHPGTICRNPGIVGMLSELSDQILRHVGLSPEHHFKCGCPLLQRCRCLSCSRQRVLTRQRAPDAENQPLTRAYILECISGRSRQ
jgi:hypothetical protein